MGYEDERDREQDRKFWEALTKKDYPQAIYHLSPRLYGMYLQAGEQGSRAEREALETQMKQTLAGLLFPTPDLALWKLERWFGFGEFRDIAPYANPERVQVLAELDAQQVAIVCAILEDGGWPFKIKWRRRGVSARSNPMPRWVGANAKRSPRSCSHTTLAFNKSWRLGAATCTAGTNVRRSVVRGEAG